MAQLWINKASIEELMPEALAPSSLSSMLPRHSAPSSPRQLPLLHLSLLFPAAVPSFLLACSRQLSACGLFCAINLGLAWLQPSKALLWLLQAGLCKCASRRDPLPWPPLPGWTSRTSSISSMVFSPFIPFRDSFTLAPLSARIKRSPFPKAYRVTLTKQ